MIDKLFSLLTNRQTEIQGQDPNKQKVPTFQKDELVRYRKQCLNNVLSIAQGIAKKNPEALVDFVRLLGRKIQSYYMCRVAVELQESKRMSLFPEYVWFPKAESLNSDGQTLETVKRKTNVTRTLNLSCDLVLPWPWKYERFINNFIDLGAKRQVWQQDFMNHSVEYWLPFGIGWVHGGNHSMMLGIIQGQGMVTAESVYDVSSLFELVHFDGNAFIRTDTSEILFEVEHFEFACIFEVGRIMQKYGVSA